MRFFLIAFILVSVIGCNDEKILTISNKNMSIANIKEINATMHYPYKATPDYQNRVNRGINKLELGMSYDNVVAEIVAQPTHVGYTYKLINYSQKGSPTGVVVEYLFSQNSDHGNSLDIKIIGFRLYFDVDLKLIDILEFKESDYYSPGKLEQER